MLKKTTKLKTKKLLLHVCCACCSTEVYNRLKEDYAVTLFWYNPNIYPYAEYKKRFDSFKKLVKNLGCQSICHSRENGNPCLAGRQVLLVDPRLRGDDKTSEINFYKIENQTWQKSIAGLEKEPEGGLRCERCYRYRLEKTAEIAKENGFDIFATTLTISPHKNATIINQIGKYISAQVCHSREGGNLLLVGPHLHGDDNKKSTFLAADFKKQDGFKKSIELSHKHNLYRQNYCGCKYSIPHKVLYTH